MRPINARLPLIVVKRHWFDEFAAGRKTVEYRRYGRMFTERTFYPGRTVRITFNYNPVRSPFLLAIVKAFQRVFARDVPDMPIGVYPDLTPNDALALIHLEIIDRHDP